MEQKEVLSDKQPRVAGSSNGRNNSAAQNGLQHPEAMPATNWTERLANDQFVKFVWKWRSQALALVCVGVLGFLYYYYSQEALKTKMKEAARVFSEGRAELTKYEQFSKERDVAPDASADNAADKDKEALQEQANNSLKLAQTKFEILAQSEGIYATIAKVYQLKILVKTGQLEQALQGLEQLNYQDHDLNTDQRLYREVAWLFVGRAALDSDNSGGDNFRPRGLKILRELAATGKVAAVPAAITLTNLADTNEDKAAIQAKLNDLLERYPEQSELLEEALESL